MAEFYFDYTRSLIRFLGSEVIGVPHPSELRVIYAGTQISTATLRGDYYRADLFDQLVAELESGILQYTFDTDSEDGVTRFAAIVIYTPG